MTSTVEPAGTTDQRQRSRAACLAGSGTASVIWLFDPVP